MPDPNRSHPACYFLLSALILLAACSSEPGVIKDLGNRSFLMVNQDSSAVRFPTDFKGQITVVGFIYTNCPDVCPAITANMSNVSTKLENTEDVRFVGVTFDPERDTPPVLKKYMHQFKLDEDRFTFLTGDTATVDSLLNAMNIYAEVSYTKTTDEGRELYFMNHTNRITLMDPRGRIRAEYSGSYSDPAHIVEDINRLR